MGNMYMRQITGNPWLLEADRHIRVTAATAAGDAASPPIEIGV
jgi:hypothetical protein